MGRFRRAATAVLAARFVPRLASGPALGLALGLSAGLVAPLSAAAQPSFVRTGDALDWRAARLSGSDRLLLFSLLRDKPRGYREAALTVARRQALTKDPGERAYIAERRASAFPVLSWDDNINGGLPGDGIVLGGVRFVPTEDAARAGVVLGLGGSGRLAWAVGDGVRVALQAAATHVHAPEEDLSRSTAGASACATRTTTGFAFVEGCLRLAAVDRDLSSTVSRRVELRGGRVFASALGDHELSLGIFRDDRDGVPQDGVTATLLTARGGLGALGASLSLGERVEGRGAVDLYGALWVTREAAGGAPMRVSLSYARERGARLLGSVAREDRTVTASLSRPIADGLSATVGLTRRDSTIDGFGGTSLSLGLSFDGWSWSGR